VLCRRLVHSFPMSSSRSLGQQESIRAALCLAVEQWHLGGAADPGP